MDQHEITKSYKTTYKKFGLSHKSLKWKNEEAAKKRYLSLISDLDFENKSVLDVGCGFGNIIPFIENKTKNFTYKGIDIIPEFIQKAKELNPDKNFEVLDFIKEKIDKKYDIVLACGCLNTNRENNLEFRKEVIKKLFDTSNYAFAFNMAGNDPQPVNKNNNIWYADSKIINDYCFTLTENLIFKSGYAYKDFTIVMFK